MGEIDIIASVLAGFAILLFVFGILPIFCGGGPASVAIGVVGLLLVTLGFGGSKMAYGDEDVDDGIITMMVLTGLLGLLLLGTGIQHCIG